MSTQDYGSDSLGDGMHKMIPSGDIVSLEERNKRLANRKKPNVVVNEIFGMSWDELELRQGGKLKRNV